MEWYPAVLVFINLLQYKMWIDSNNLLQNKCAAVTFSLLLAMRFSAHSDAPSLPQGQKRIHITHEWKNAKNKQKRLFESVITVLVVVRVIVTSGPDDRSWLMTAIMLWHCGGRPYTGGGGIQWSPILPYRWSSLFWSWCCLLLVSE